MEQKRLRVAVYCRVASYDQTVMRNQEEKLCQFAREQGIDGIVIYSDNGYSGLNLDRPGFKQLEADIRAGMVRAVIAADFSRLARNLFLASDCMDEMRKAGVKVIFVNHPDNEVQSLLRHRLFDEWRKGKKVPQKF